MTSSRWQGTAAEASGSRSLSSEDAGARGLGHRCKLLIEERAGSRDRRGRPGARRRASDGADEVQRLAGSGAVGGIGIVEDQLALARDEVALEQQAIGLQQAQIALQRLTT